MAGLTINEEREEYVTFSDPYYKASQRLVTLADDTAFDDCKDAASVEEVLKGLSASDKIGGQQGTTAQYFVEGSDDWGFEGLPAEWVPYKSASLAVQDMINGNVKYVIIDAAPARYGSLPLFDCIGTWQETLCFCYLEVLWETSGTNGTSLYRYLLRKTVTSKLCRVCRIRF